MKKAITLLLVLGLTAMGLAVPALAGKKKVKKVERMVEVEYMGGGIGIASPAASGGVCPMDPAASPDEQPVCIEVLPTIKEKYVQVQMEDATGMSIAGYVSQGDTDGDGIGNLYGDFCGGHPEPIKMLASAPLRVSFYNGACDDGTPSIVTQGTITVTFSNIP